MTKSIAVILAACAAFYCASATARFIQGDPMGLIPNPTPTPVTAADVLRHHQLNRPLNHPYVYVNNNPLRYTDPLGLEPVGTIPEDPSKAAVFYNLPRSMRKPSGGCVVDCILKRRVACLPVRGAGMLGGLGVAAVGSFASQGTAFPTLVGPSVAIGGTTGDMICDTYFFEQSCQEECNKNSCPAY